MRRTRTLGSALAALLAVTALTGATAATASGRPTAPARAAAVTLPAVIDYVALGDSYSAAPLVPGPPARPGVRNDPVQCVRSWNNYPAFLAGYLGVRSYTDVTCSGADTSDLVQPQGGDTPYAAPQVAALSAETDLVTLGIGGNDLGLFGSLISECGRLARAHPGATAPCRRHFTVHGVDTKRRDARRIQARVTTAVREVRAAAPHARVIVVGYPRILPRHGTCDRVGFAAGDAAWGFRVEQVLNRSLRRAAQTAGARYVGFGRASSGHDACGRRPWINGKDLVLGGPDGAADFHPFLRGTRGVARHLFEAMTGRTAPTYRNARTPVSAIVTNPVYPPPA